MMNVEEVLVQKVRPESAPGHDVDSQSTGERSLVAQAKSGCPIAFGQLYERHRLRTYHTAFRILRNCQDAEDAVQRGFQRVFTNLCGFREDSTFSTWVTRIVMNEALMMLRQRRATTPISETSNDGIETSFCHDFPDEGPTPEQALAEKEVRDTVMHAISRLRKSLRTVVLLHEFQGLTSSEIARRLGLSVAAVKGRTFHARRFLRKHLERKFKSSAGSILIGA